MRKKLGRVMCLLFLLSIAFSRVSPERFRPALTPGLGTPGHPAVQDYPPQKPKYDYMSSFYSRNTRPLGLKEDVALRRLMRQPGIRWAIRAGIGHILN